MLVWRPFSTRILQCIDEYPTLKLLDQKRESTAISPASVKKALDYSDGDIKKASEILRISIGEVEKAVATIEGA